MRARLLLLLLGASVFFFGFLFGRARHATPAKTQPGNSAVFIPAVPAPKVGSSTQSVSINMSQNILKDFQQWAENYATAGPIQRIQLLTNGLSLAAERREILAGLIESNPAE